MGVFLMEPTLSTFYIVMGIHKGCVIMSFDVSLLLTLKVVEQTVNLSVIWDAIAIL